MSAHDRDQVILNATPNSVIEYQYNDIGIETAQETHTYQRNPAYNVLQIDNVTGKQETTDHDQGAQAKVSCVNMREIFSVGFCCKTK